MKLHLSYVFAALAISFPIYHSVCSVAQQIQVVFK